MTRPFVVLVLLAIAITASACDDREGMATSTGTPSATTSATMSPHPGAVVVTPMPTATPVPPDDRQQVIMFELATGEFTSLLPPLHDDYYAAWNLFPRFTPDGQHVWVSERDAAVSRKYGLDGDVVEQWDGAVGVHEEPGEMFVYLHPTDEGWQAAARVDGEEYLIARAYIVWRTTLSPDGRYAATWADYSEDMVTTVVSETTTGTVLATAEETGLCTCDGGPALYWSPSGRYVAYPDFARLPHQGSEGGFFALDSETGERVFLLDSPWGTVGSGWLPGDRHVAVRDGWVVVLDVASDTVAWQIAPMPADATLAVAGGALAIRKRVSESPYQVRTRAFDVNSGAPLGEWDSDTRPLAFDDGVAFVSSGDETCPALLTHPGQSGEVCLPSSAPTFSPDGRLVATYEGAGVRVYRLDAGVLHEIARYERPDLLAEGIGITPVEWNPQGTHLLIAIGFGL